MNFGYSVTRLDKNSTEKPKQFKKIKTYVMTEISIHEHNIVTCALLKSIDVSTSKSQFSSPSEQNDLVLLTWGIVNFLQLLDLLLSSIWTVVVNHDDFHRNFLLLRSFHEEIDDQRKILSFVIGWKDDADVVVLVD